MLKFVSGLDLACLILREERHLAAYRRYKHEPFVLTRHQKKKFKELGFFSFRVGSSEPVLVRSEKKVLKRLLDREKFTITQKAWIYGSCWTYVVPDSALPRVFEAQFAWCAFLDQLPKHAVSQRKLSVVVGMARESLNRKLKSKALSRLISVKRTFLFSTKPTQRNHWFKTHEGGYLRPWNNEYKSKVEHVRVHRTFAFEKKSLYKAFRDENNSRSVPAGRRTRLSPQSGPASWKTIIRRTISRTSKVRSRVPASVRNSAKILSSEDLYNLTYSVTDQERIMGSKQVRYAQTTVKLVPSRLIKDEPSCATHSFVVRRGTVKQISGRDWLRAKARGASAGRSGQGPEDRRAGFYL